MSLSGQLIVFVKAPRPGGVKTRLAQSIGPAAACAAYVRLVDTLLDRLAPLPGVELRYSPDDAESEISHWLRPGWRASPQGDGGLGERLARAFASTFHEGATRAAVIGSDCPAIAPSDIEETWVALERVDVVLGPAEDGGYWLIGLRHPQPQLFLNIEWSTSSVLRQTLDRSAASRLECHLLRPLADVDTVEDWHRLQANMPPPLPLA